MSNQNSNSRHPANNKMLIDATHPEETRVVVMRNGRVEEFDYESAARKLLRGNIYLAKVTRVEPSLQAAFVDYGGNRHGFLAFNEIHPDYYQIPIADRRALIEAESQAEAEEEEEADRAAEAAARRSRRRGGRRSDQAGSSEGSAIDVTDLLPPEPSEEGGDERVSEPSETRAESGEEAAGSQMSERAARDPVMYSDPHGEDERPTPASGALHADTGDQPASEREAGEHVVEHLGEERRTGGTEHDRDHHHDHHHDDHGHEPHGGDDHTHHDAASDANTGEGRIETVETGNGGEAEQIETVTASEDVLEEVPVRPRRRLRSYKIQEVTKRRQVLLVQVVKEERGTKGAALTTYLSLAGRYTVLMPNTARGGGISRKISNPQDRKRLKAIAAELDVPEGMGLIIRTAGAARTKQEIKRDYEYLLRLWESVRELALSSNAPALVYEEGNLIKRSIRDLYGKEVEEIVVAGEEAFAEARDFMRMLMPSHAKNVLSFDDPEPLFTRFGIERQLNAMFSPYVHLRSGGYLVINQTEALVAIDINSGKSTREFSIEETALSTNLEAADEIARQLKLRDLAGLIVIDFIDMEEKRNNRAVERRLKDALRHDRARIQLGRISHFGLLEMSRQRMRTGVLEGSTTQCPHCQGTGIIRSTESVALAVLRGLEDSLMNGPPASLIATTTSTVALYILNNKRPFITEMEGRYGITIQIQASDKVQGANFTVERQARRDEPQRRVERTAVNMDWGFEDEGQEEAEPETEAVEESRGGESRGGPSQREASGEHGGSADGRRRRRRRRGRRGDREPGGDERRFAEGGERGGASSFERGSDEEGGIEEVHDDAADDIETMDEAGGFEGRTSGAAGDETSAELHSADGEDEDDGAPRSENGEGQQGERRRRRRRGRRGGRRNQERERSPGGEGQVQRGDGDDGAGTVGRAELNGEPNDRGASDTRHVERETDWRSARAAESAAERDAGSVVASPTDHVSDSTYGSSAPASFEPQDQAASRPVSEHQSADELHPAPVAQATPPAPAPQEPVAEQKPAAQPEPEPEPKVEVPPAHAARIAPVASEPVLARVVVGPDATAAPQPVDDTQKPARRGWWQRR